MFITFYFVLFWFFFSMSFAQSFILFLLRCLFLIDLYVKHILLKNELHLT